MFRSLQKRCLRTNLQSPNSDPGLTQNLPLQSPKKWSKIVSIPLKSKLHHLAFRPNNGARDNVLAVATETELAVFKICSEVFGFVFSYDFMLVNLEFLI